MRCENLGVVLQDMNFHRDAMSGEEGEALLRAIKQLEPDLPVLLMAAFQSLEAAVREGASDYIAKPRNDDKLVATVKSLLRLRELSRGNLRLLTQTNRARHDLAS